MSQSTINIAVHRGSDEIGGNCVEISTSRSRLILDVGMPLSEMTASPGRRQKPDRDDLIRRGIIRPIPGLFVDGPCMDGILLSHAHGDHVGLMEFALPDIPVYLSRGTSKMVMSGSLFAGQRELPRDRQRILIPGKARKIGDFTVTGHLVDHSSFGSMAFLIEAAGKRIVYSGDLRQHGRKPGMAAALFKAIDQAPLDLLIMEGTSLSRSREPGPSEKDVETQLVASLKQTSGLALAMFSPQNVDRLVSYYRAAARIGRTFVLDPYAAFVLHLIKSECKVPDPFRDERIKVLVTESFPRSHAGRRLPSLIPRMKKAGITLAEILADPRRFLMVFRERMLETIFNGELPSGSQCFYSYWPGYLTANPSLKELRARLEASGCAFEAAHASGHLYYSDIMGFIRRASPRKLMPIHTTNAKLLAEVFPDQIVNTSTWSLE